MIERTALKIRTLIGLGCLMMSAAVSSFEHDHSLVDFTVYSDNVIQESRQQGKPYFLLFSKAFYQQHPELLEANSASIAKRAWSDGCWKLHSGDDSDFDDQNQAYVTGQNIGRIQTLKPAAAIVSEMCEQAIADILSCSSSRANL